MGTDVDIRWGPRGWKIVVHVRKRGVSEKVLQTPVGSRGSNSFQEEPRGGDWG